MDKKHFSNISDSSLIVCFSYIEACQVSVKRSVMYVYNSGKAYKHRSWCSQTQNDDQGDKGLKLHGKVDKGLFHHQYENKYFDYLNEALKYLKMLNHGWIFFESKYQWHIKISSCDLSTH